MTDGESHVEVEVVRLSPSVMAPGLVPGERATTDGHQAVEVGKFFEGNKIWRFYETGWSAVNLGSLPVKLTAHMTDMCWMLVTWLRVVSHRTSISAASGSMGIDEDQCGAVGIDADRWTMTTTTTAKTTTTEMTTAITIMTTTMTR